MVAKAQEIDPFKLARMIRIRILVELIIINVNGRTAFGNVGRDGVQTRARSLVPGQSILDAFDFECSISLIQH